MLIVDAQIHLWEKGKPSGHHRQGPTRRSRQSPAWMPPAWDRALIRPVMWDPDSNELAVEAVWAYPDRFAIMGWFYLDQPENRALVERWTRRRAGVACCCDVFADRPPDRRAPPRP
jgi:hypothetical protein